MKMDVPIAQKYMLTISEAAIYFRIGENKLAALAKEHPDADWVFYNGNRVQIKRQKFEKVLDNLTSI